MSLQSSKIGDTLSSIGFTPLDKCWICKDSRLTRIHQDKIALSQFSEEDPELSAYTGSRFWLVRCLECDFIQPEAVPTLPNYFDRMYDQQWSEEWMEHEFNSKYKDFIFGRVLDELSRRVGARERNLLDIGAHVGRLIYLAREAGWQAEGVELNSRTSSYAARKTKLPVHRANAQSLIAEGRRYDAITMIDVLEHIPDPVEMLAQVHGLLDAQGWIAVKVPCGRNQLVKEQIRSRLRGDGDVSIAANLVHINHFSPTSLRLALERAGFASIKLSIGAPELPEVAASARAVGSNAFRLSVYYLGQMIPGGIHTPLALNLQAYAQKGASKSVTIPQ
jgi:SAM-dependent methyltransferase